MKKTLLLLIVVSGLGLVLRPSAHATSLDRRVEQIDQQQRIIERKWELQEEKTKDTAKVTAGKEGFQFKSGDGKFVLRLRGLIQLDGRFLC